MATIEDESVIGEAVVSYLVQQIFTPNQHAKVNFVPRVDLENQLVDSLRTPGKQIIVYGHPGSGKSSVVRKKLMELYPANITTQCQRSMTFEQALLNAFDQLDQYYPEVSSTKTVASKSRSLEAKYFELKAAVSKTSSTESQLNLRRVVPPQLTAQRLSQFLGEKGLCWVLEDFHKLIPEEKVHLSQSLKVFVDASSEYETVRVICLGAVMTAREVVEYDPEMRKRVAEIHVPLMSREELLQIMINGCKLLNIEIDGWIKHEIVRFSAGLASVCHQLALNMCNVASVSATQPVLVKLVRDVFDKAVVRYVSESSDTLKSQFDIALRRHRVREYDNTRIILTVLARAGEDGLTNAELLQAIRKSVPKYPQSNLTKYLAELQSTDRGELILCDGASGRFSFSDPLYQAYARAKLVPPDIKGHLSTHIHTLLDQIIKQYVEKSPV